MVLFCDYILNTSNRHWNKKRNFTAQYDGYNVIDRDSRLARNLEEIC
ncbi:hypothetical protein KsCSTR_35520 [Candidatus Kuenenia stuttgartiensis]|uniref:Uncharacterized protein n=1 Tax=Kuenenia stuttgartiensis TaxID=174633 RepID=A0A6G7GTZ8_KUEST|nr:hypothetical protein KsCSTR_35520 [Candidatus Kuenenia stuttgartiensis]